MSDRQGLLVDERTAVRVGAVALLGGLAAVVFVAAVLPQLELSDAVHVRVYYLELAGMREGAPVRSAGEVIGRVEAISFAPARAAGQGEAGDPLGGAAGAVVHLALEPESIERAWRDGDYVISSRGPLSSRYVEIIPPRPGPSAGPVTEGAELRGVDPPTLDRVMTRTWDNLVIARRFAQDVGPEARLLRDEVTALFATWRELAGELPGAPAASLDELLARFEALRAEAERSWQDVLGGQAGLERSRALWGKTRALTQEARAVAGELAASLEHIRAELARVQAQVGGAAVGERFAQLLDQLRGLSAKLDAVAASVRVVSERWQRREGTLGRLLTDPEFPEDAKELGKILKRQPWRIFGHPDDSTDGAAGGSFDDEP